MRREIYGFILLHWYDYNNFTVSSILLVITLALLIVYVFYYFVVVQIVFTTELFNFYIIYSISLVIMLYNNLYILFAFVF